MDDAVRNKQCSTCSLLLPLDHFYNNKSSKDGKTGQCKQCHKDYYKRNKEKILIKKRAYHWENRDAILDYQRKRYPLVREQRCKESLQKYCENKEKILEQRKAHYAKNKEKIKSRHTIYRQRNRGLIISLALARQKKIQDQYRALTESEKAAIRYIYARAAELQARTGIEMHVDHIMPLSKGGPHHPDNLQILTADDNLAKRAQSGWQDRAWPLYDEDGEPTGDSRPLLSANSEQDDGDES